MLLPYVKIAPLLMILMALSSCLYTVEETAAINLQAYADSVSPRNSEVAVPETDPFLVLINQLKDIGYYQQKQNCAYAIDSGYCCLIPPAENIISKTITSVNSELEAGSPALGPEKAIPLVNLEGLLEIKSCFLRADYEVQENTYPRATVEEWTFDEEPSAAKVEDQLNQLSEDEWYYISKTPISWWRNNHKLYFIFPGGNFMLSEIPKLQQKMLETM